MLIDNFEMQNLDDSVHVLDVSGAHPTPVIDASNRMFGEDSTEAFLGGANNTGISFGLSKTQ
jgi:hypothetical protein